MIALLAGCIAVSLPGRPHTGPLPPADDPLAASAARIEAHVRVLATEIGPRQAREHPEALRTAERYVSRQWTAMGLAVHRQPVSGDTANLEVRLGEGGPVVVVGAHFDSVAGSPGADDNASGVAALLELTRSLVEAPPPVPLRLVAWTNEEWPFGLEGSRTHARSLEVEVRGALSLEMLGTYAEGANTQRAPFPFGLFYPDEATYLVLVGNGRSRRWMRTLGRALREAEPFPIYGVAAPPSVGTDRSDHASYWALGAPGVMLTDTAEYRYGHHHRATDVPERLDYERIARVTRGLAAALHRL